LICFFGFHDIGVGGGALLLWQEFFMFVDAWLILSMDNTCASTSVADRYNSHVPYLGALQPECSPKSSFSDL